MDIQTTKQPQNSNRLAFYLMLMMMLLQMGWLGAMWFTGATTSSKVPMLIGLTLISGLILLFLPLRQQQILASWQESLWRYPTRWLNGLWIGFLLVGILYAIYQRVWPFDEEMSHNASKLIAEAGVSTFFAQYVQLEWLGAQHPPLIILLNGFVYELFGVDLLFARLVTLLFALGILVLTYQLGRILYDATTGLLAAFAMATFPLFMRLGTTSMLDIQVTFFALLGIYLCTLVLQKQSYRLAVGAGLVLGLGLVTKYIMVLIAPVVLGYFILQKALIRTFPRLLVVVFCASLILFTWLGFAYSQDILAAQQARITWFASHITRSPEITRQLAFASQGRATANESQVQAEQKPQNDRAVPFFRVRIAYGTRVAIETLLTRLPSALGVYAIPIIALGLVTSWQRRSWREWFILSWIILIWVPLLLTLPDHRYFMLSFPALALLAARGLLATSDNTMRVLLLVLLYCAGSLYLFVDWSRGTHLFIS